MLLQSKGWTIVVLLSLAIGIGATTALFTAVNGLLLQTVPVRDPGELVNLKWAGENHMVRSSSDYGFSTPSNGRRVRTTFSFATYQQLQAANQTLTAMFAGAPFDMFNVTANGSSDLACIGLFGLVSYSVSRRTNEIGVRMALGAQRSGVVGMLLRESMLMVAIGVLVGLAAALAGGRFITSVLFGLSATDAWMMGGAIAVTALVSLAAGYLPARRASRVDPMVALRYE